MVDLLKYVTADSIRYLDMKGYDKILKHLVSDALNGYDEKIKKEVLEEIKAGAKSNQPLDINLGRGFALVHAKNDNVRKIHLVIALLPAKTALVRGEPAHTLIFIILPGSQSRTYLSMLARLGRMLSKDDAEKAFTSAASIMAEGRHAEGIKAVIDYVSDFEKG